MGGTQKKMQRAVGVEKEPLTATQSFRNRALILLCVVNFGWDVISKLLNINTSVVAGHVACNLQFLCWPASLMVPSRYPAFVANHCASGDMAGVVPVLALLAKFSLATLVELAMWLSLWFDRRMPRWIIARGERRAFQSATLKPLTERGLIARRVMFALGTTSMIAASYVILFDRSPDQTQTDLMMLIFASSSFIFAMSAFAAVSVWLALLVKR